MQNKYFTDWLNDWLTDWLTDYFTRFSTARFASRSEILVRYTLQCTMQFRLAPASGAATKPNPKNKLDRSPTGMRTPPTWIYLMNDNAWNARGGVRYMFPTWRRMFCSNVRWYCIQKLPCDNFKYYYTQDSCTAVVRTSSAALATMPPALVTSQFRGLNYAIMNWTILQQC